MIGIILSTGPILLTINYAIQVSYVGYIFCGEYLICMNRQVIKSQYLSSSQPGDIVEAPTRMPGS